MELKDWIKASRLAAGMTQDSLGVALGKTKANVSGWENGRHEPSYDQVVRIADLSRWAVPLPGVPVGASWPLSRITQEDWAGLDERDRASIEGAMMVVLAQLRGDAPQPQRASSPAQHHINTAETSIEASQAANDDSFQEIRRYKVKFAAGDGIISFQQVLGSSLAFRHEFLREHGVTWENGAVVYASGNSMEPVIPDGAAMLMRRETLSLDEIKPGAVYGIRLGGELVVKTIVRDSAGRWVARSFNAAVDDRPIEGDESAVIVGQVVWAGARLVPDGGHQWVKKSGV